LSGDVREPTAVGVVKAFPLRPELAEIVGNCLLLVCWARPQIREAARREINSTLRLYSASATHGGDVGARGGEDWLETGRVFAVIGLASRAWTSITAG